MKEWLRKVETSGDAYERGKQYGEQTQDLISDYIQYTDLFYEKHGFSKQEIDRIRFRYEWGIKQQAEELITEFKGMAIGASVNFNVLMNAILHMEIRAAALWGTKFLDPVKDIQEECTTFAAAGQATSDLQPMIGQTFDFSREMQKYIVVALVEPEKGNSFVTVGVLGRPGSAGLNDKGLALVMSGVRPKEGLEILGGDGPLGVPPTWTHHILRNFSDVDDAIETITRKPRGPKGENLLLCDMEKMAHLEVSYERYNVEVQNMDDCILSSANHFSSNGMRSLGPSLEDYLGSYLRRDRALELLKDNHGEIDLETLQRISIDHEVPGGSICRHGREEDRGTNVQYQDQGYTVSSMIADPGHRRFWISRGPPCMNDYRLFNLG